MNEIVFGIKRRHWCHIAAAVFSVLFVSPIVAMRADNKSPIVVIKTDFDRNTVSPGQPVRVTWTAIELRACEGEVHRRFIDSAGVIFDTAAVPTVYRGQLSDQSKTFSREITIPSGMAPGIAFYTGVRRYWCNPMQVLLRGLLGFEIIVPVEPVRFFVQ